MADNRIGSYIVVAPIGAGAMGEVYRARDARLDRDVAIKILPPAFASDPDRRARFLIAVYDPQPPPKPATVVVNWRAMLKGAR